MFNVEEKRFLFKLTKHLLIRSQDFKSRHTIDQGNDDERADERPREPDEDFNDLNPELADVPIEEDPTSDLDPAVGRVFLPSKQPGADGGRDATYAVGGEGIAVIDPAPAAGEIRELDAQRLATHQSANDAETEGRRHVDEPSSGRDHDEAGNGAHESGIDGPLPGLEERDSRPRQGARRCAQVRHAQRHHGLEVEGQRGTGVEGEPGAPDYDEGEELEERVARSVEADVGWRSLF